MVQDIFPYKYNNAYTNAEPKDGSPVIICFNQKILCRCFETETERVAVPTVSEAESIWGISRQELKYLFGIDDIDFYLCDRELEETEEYKWEHTLTVRGRDPQYLSFAIVVGAHLAHWYSTNKFCSRCGAKLIHSDTQRALKCPECGNILFPRINPIIITAVTDGDKMLVAKYNRKHFNTRNNQYVLLAGYVEIGESYEDTVRREIREETGLEIRNIHYVASQPWPFSQTSIAGFYAEGDSTKPLKRQKEELSELLWVKREDLPERKNLTSITDNLIEWFRAGMTYDEIWQERENLASRKKE